MSKGLHEWRWSYYGKIGYTEKGDHTLVEDSNKVAITGKIINREGKNYQKRNRVISVGNTWPVTLSQ